MFLVMLAAAGAIGAGAFWLIRRPDLDAPAATPASPLDDAPPTGDAPSGD